MNILFIAVSNNPFEATQGSSQRSNLLLTACTQIAQVDVISFCTDSKKYCVNYNIIHQEVCRKTNREGRFSKFRKLLTPRNPNSVYTIDSHKELIIDNAVAAKKYDYIVIRYIPHAIECGLWKYANRLIIDIDDNPIDRALNDAQNAKSLRNKLYLKVYANILKYMVHRIVDKICLAFVCNPKDKINKNNVFLPNVPFYTVDKNVKYTMLKKRIIFVGDLNYWINQEGISLFLQNIYTQVLRSIPDIEMHIVGRIADNTLKKKWESYKGVVVTGFVENLIDEYDNASVAVIPIYHGAGTCIKVLEAMQMHKICVTTPIGFRGYDNIFKPNEDCFVATTDEQFVEFIITSICNEQLRNKITQSAFDKQQKFYTKERFYQIVKESL